MRRYILEHSKDFQALEDDDPIAKWFQPGLGLHDGFGQKVHTDLGGHVALGTAVRDRFIDNWTLAAHKHEAKQV